MRERVIVYGLGANFRKYKENIFVEYTVVGLSDKDEQVLAVEEEACKKIKVENIRQELATCDKVLITCNRYGEVTKFLVDNFKMPLERIEAYVLKENNGKGYVRFYGEHNEDAIVALILKQAKLAVSDIAYLDIGVNHPIECNNSYYFYERGASGVLVDPLEWSKYASVVARPRDKFMLAAVSDETKVEGAAFYVCDNDALSSLHADHRKRWDGKTNNGLRANITVDIIGVNDILQSMNPYPQVIFIDAEGEDIKIALAIDYQKYKPLIICAEVCGYPTKIHDDFVMTMQEKGYNLYSNINNVNDIFVKDSIMKELNEK